MRILYLMSFLSISISQFIDLNDPTTFSVGPAIETPALGGNLKPEIQPNWNQVDWLQNIEDSKVQVLRWPGAEGANYFDWTKGRSLPCYKWIGKEGGLYDCETVDTDYCTISAGSVPPVCQRGDNDLTARLIHQEHGLLLGLTQPYPDNEYGNHVNTDYKRIWTDEYNFASNYLNALVNIQGSQKAQPFFIINMLNPSYIDMDVAIFDEECIVTNLADAVRNTIGQQLDSIALAHTQFGIPVENIHIQLSNEPWMARHGYVREIWPDAAAYAHDAIEVALGIRNHPVLANAKIGIVGDGQKSKCSYDSNTTNLSWAENLRYQWNDMIWDVILSQNYAHLFDAVSFHTYYGLSDAKFSNSILSNSPWQNWADEYFDNWHKSDIFNLLNEDSISGNFGYLEVLNDIDTLVSANYLTHGDFFSIDNLMYWILANTDKMINEYEGKCVDGSEGDNTWVWLTHGIDKDFWVTEYATAGKIPHVAPYHGTWLHTIQEFYTALKFMESIPNIDIMITNNFNGFNGSYRLVDTYSEQDLNGTILCSDYLSGECGPRCSHTYTGLSAKGKAYSLLHHLTTKHTTFSKLNLPYIGTNLVGKASMSDNDIQQCNPDIDRECFRIRDIHGWTFNSTQNEATRDYLFLNVSPQDYTIKLPTEYEYEIQIIGVDGYDNGISNSEDYYTNLFNKNYFNTNPAVNAKQTNDHYDGYLKWQFNGSPFSTSDSDLFSHSNDVNFLNLNPTICENENEVIIPRHSIAKIEYIGFNNPNYPDFNSDCEVNINDIIILIDIIINNDPEDYVEADINGDGLVNVVDVVYLVQIVLNN